MVEGQFHIVDTDYEYVSGVGGDVPVSRGLLLFKFAHKVFTVALVADSANLVRKLHDVCRMFVCAKLILAVVTVQIDLGHFGHGKQRVAINEQR